MTTDDQTPRPAGAPQLRLATGAAHGSAAGDTAAASEGEAAAKAEGGALSPAAPQKPAGALAAAQASLTAKLRPAIEKISRPPEIVPGASGDIRGTVLFGTGVVVATFVVFGLWAATAPLSSAVAAPATLTVEGLRRSVQHLEGGIVSQILVHEGDRVEQGDILLKLDPVGPAATVHRLRTQLDTQMAIDARLFAERTELPDIAFPPELLLRTGDPDLDAIMAGQTQQFEERRASLNGQLSILQQRIEQLQSQITGHEDQYNSFIAQVALLQEELEAIRPLLQRGLVTKPRALALEREVARLEGTMAEITSSIAVANQSIGETRLQMEQTRQQWLEEVITQKRETESRVSDLRQQFLVAQDVMNRLEVVAPQSGIIQNQRVTTVGGVISPGQVLMEIAPSSDELMIQARVSPQDVANVSVGQDAEVRFVSLDLRRTPEILGRVMTLSGDRLVDEHTGEPYFLAQVQTTPEELEKLRGQRIHAGMPAEVFIQTGSRTLLQYVTKPLTDAIAHGLNET